MKNQDLQTSVSTLDISEAKFDLIQDRINYLRDNADFASVLFKSLIGYAILAADYDRNIIAYNEGARQLYGYAPEEIIGKQTLEIFFPREFTESGKLEIIIRELIDKERFSCEGEKVRKDGSRFPAQILLTITRDKNGQILGFVEIVEDLTERKRAHEVLQSSEAALRKIIETNADVILIVDTEGMVRYANRAAEALFGFKPEGLIGQTLGFPVVTGETAEIEIIGRSGETRVAEMRVVKMDWESKSAYLASLRDITERKGLDKLKDEFISIASHELRTPLTSIKTSVDLILKGKTGEINDAQERFLLMAERNIKRLSVIMEDLLDLSKLEAGKLKLRAHFFSMAELIKNTASEFVYLTLEKNISLDYEFLQEEIYVFADEDKVRQVLANFLSNAFKCTPQGGWVRIICMDKKSEIVVCVEDSGIGIAEKNIPRLFTKFARLDEETHPGVKGTGLGLAICKEIIALHKGRIWVETKLGEGSKFYFSLPALNSDEMFEEHMNSVIKEAMEKGSYFSLIIISILNLKELFQKSPIKAKEFFKELQDLVNNALREVNDIVVRTTGEILIILPYTKKDGAIPVLDRIKDELEVFISKGEDPRGKFDVVTGLVSYPEDGKTKKELLNRLRQVKNSIY